ncbi:MAG: YfdX family protein, partial [Epsilonproteobacteria bacterium]|nr:YfdX family protein [Campylobacterota bacterium]
MKKRLLLSALTCGLLLSTTAIEANTNSQTLINNQIKKHHQETKQVPKAVVEAIQDTFKAVHALEANKIDDAKKLLKEADEKFTASLKKDPSLDLLPLEESVVRYTYMGSSQDISKALALTVKLINDNDTQVAQTVLGALKDEVDINIVSIPMKLYPVTTKKALDALNKGDKKTALMTLAEGFGMLVNTQIVIPTPLLVAQELVIEASQMDKTKKKDVEKLLVLAKEELKRAKLLGYTKPHEKAYKLINEDIEKLEKEIKGKNI